MFIHTVLSLLDNSGKQTVWQQSKQYMDGFFSGAVFTVNGLRNSGKSYRHKAVLPDFSGRWTAKLQQLLPEFRSPSTGKSGETKNFKNGSYRTQVCCVGGYRSCYLAKSDLKLYKKNAHLTIRSYYTLCTSESRQMDCEIPVHKKGHRKCTVHLQVKKIQYIDRNIYGY